MKTTPPTDNAGQTGSNEAKTLKQEVHYDHESGQWELWNLSDPAKKVSNITYTDARERWDNVRSHEWSSSAYDHMSLIALGQQPVPPRPLFGTEELLGALHSVEIILTGDACNIPSYYNAKREVDHAVAIIREARQKGTAPAKPAETTEPANTVPTIAAILANPTASDWLKNALRSAANRDCVDAANDAELLAAVLVEAIRI